VNLNRRDAVLTLATCWAFTGKLVGRATGCYEGACELNVIDPKG
jgi:hypothetical protein